MSNKQLTDAQLSERVCKALGIERLPRVAWDPLPHYPNVLDGAGFLRVVERLRELNVYVSTYVHPDTVEVEVVPVKGCYHGEDEKSLPRALALAVLEWEASRRGVE